mmetsp:Transcript_17896/g.26479  ORF Transcript_17896/g.26479 Transcript_17896/m.26479 type:complete len:569 (-) Transcript_17896:213-1919(-)
MAANRQVIPNNNTNDENKIIRMIEFFSGIGGMRLAVEKALNNNVTVCKAYDISLHANNTYNHNHSDHSKVITKLVEQLKPVDLDGKADLWTMSPPCQPFTNTRGSKQMDIDDKRCAGLKALLQLLSTIEEKPMYIFFENVKDFSTSRLCQTLWYECLERNGYERKEYLASPIQIGIPNHRMRYYCLCRRTARGKQGGITSARFHSLPIRTTTTPEEDLYPKHPVLEYLDASLCRRDSSEDHNNEEQRHLFSAMEPYLVPTSVLEQPWASNQLGIVTAADTATHCFTAAYGRIYHKATGSLLDVTTEEEQNDHTLRRFSPRELLNLFGFPPSFTFPSSLKLEHQYKLVGNSINVTVVALLMQELLLEPSFLILDNDDPRHEKDEIDSHDATFIFANNRDDCNSSKAIPSVVGGSHGHITETISGPINQLYQFYGWNMIRNCTGRYTCRDHAMVSSLTPIQMLRRAGIDNEDLSSPNGYFTQYEFEMNHYSRKMDPICVIPLDEAYTTGVITYVKKNNNGAVSFVHTLNTPSGFRRKLIAIGIQVVTKSNLSSTNHQEYSLAIVENKTTG